VPGLRHYNMGVHIGSKYECRIEWPVEQKMKLVLRMCTNDPGYNFMREPTNAIELTSEQ
jgi:hypothetical protein